MAIPPIPVRRQFKPTALSVKYDRSELHQQLGLVAQAIAPMSTRTLTQAGTIETTDDTVLCDATTAALAVTLPKANQAQWLQVSIKKIDASGHAVTITASGTDTIDGAATVSLGTQYKSRTIQSDGAGHWYVLASV